jgi:peptidoglycan/xylan/chitin deacetylase (PgdA/CDA1 family)
MPMLRLMVYLLVATCLCGCRAPAQRVGKEARVEISTAPARASATPTSSTSPAQRPDLLPPVTSAAISEGNPSLPEVALVFNVGAGAPPALELLDTLRDSGTPATFMVMAWLARAQPDLVKSIAADGFEVGSHGDTVADLTQVSDAEVAADLTSADSVIAPLIGHSTRPIWSPSAGAQDARVRTVASRLGYDTLLWSIDSGDWRTDASAAAVENAVLPRLANGSIVVLHLDSPRSRQATVAALPMILRTVRELRLTPVTLPTLLSHLAATPPAR